MAISTTDTVQLWPFDKIGRAIWQQIFSSRKGKKFLMI